MYFFHFIELWHGSHISMATGHTYPIIWQSIYIQGVQSPGLEGMKFPDFSRLQLHYFVCLRLLKGLVGMLPFQN